MNREGSGAATPPAGLKREPRDEPAMNTMDEPVDCFAVALAHADELGPEFSAAEPHLLANQDSHQADRS